MNTSLLRTEIVYLASVRFFCMIAISAFKLVTLREKKMDPWTKKLGSESWRQNQLIGLQ